MLLIIFGAGASYDSVSSRPPGEYPRVIGGENLHSRPPLADELFDDNMITFGLISNFPQCLPIIPYLQRRSHGKSVERVLEELREEAGEYAKRRKQLAAIRYYLQVMLTQCINIWKGQVVKGINNYTTLLDQIEHWNKSRESVCIVTFNYDTLLEDALPSVGISIQAIEDYISDRTYKVIKLHGSVNWGRRVAAPGFDANQNAWELAKKLIESAEQLTVSDEFSVATACPGQVKGAGSRECFLSCGSGISAKCIGSD